VLYGQELISTSQTEGYCKGRGLVESRQEKTKSGLTSGLSFRLFSFLTNGSFSRAPFYRSTMVCRGVATSALRGQGSQPINFASGLLTYVLVESVERW